MDEDFRTELAALVPEYVWETELREHQVVSVASERFQGTTVDVRHVPTDTTFRVAAEGIVVGEGSVAAWHSPWYQQHMPEQPDRYVSVIQADLPELFPVQDRTIEAHIGATARELARRYLPSDFADAIEGSLNYAARVHVSLVRRPRGGEAFSNLAVRGSHFTRVVIRHEGYVTYPAPLVAAVATHLMGALAALEKESAAQVSGIDFNCRVAHFEKARQLRLIGQSLHVWAVPIRLPSEQELFDLSDDALEAFNSQRLSLASYLATPADQQLGTLTAEVLSLLDEFTFFALLNPEPRSQLREDHIRGLLQLAMRLRVNGEGEAYVYSGKADIRFTSKNDPLSSGVAELKWWSGPQSVREMFSQAVNEHSTGQEELLVGLVLYKGREARGAFEQTVSTVGEQPECTVMDAEDLPTRSRLLLRRFTVTSHGQAVPLYVGLLDLSYENPRHPGG